MNRAFSLLELVVCMGVLGVLSLALFSMFLWGTSSFHVSSGRLELQGELQRVSDVLRLDVRRTSFNSYYVYPANVTVPDRPPDATPTATVRRDVVCFNALDDPQANGNYDLVDDGDSYPPNGQPRWNAWEIVYPDFDPARPERCRLYRYLVRRPPAAGPPTTSPQYLPFYVGFTLPPAYGYPPDPGVLVPGSLRCLTDRLRGLRSEFALGNQMVHLYVTLQGAPGRLTGGGKSLAEVLEARVTVRPGNTWPSL